MDLRKLQYQFEQSTDAAAAAEKLAQLRTDAAAGDMDLPRVQRLLKHAYDKVCASIDEAKAVRTRGVGGKYKGWLRMIPTDVAAVLALRHCINLCTRPGRSGVKNVVTVQSLAGTLGRLYETEVKVAEAEAVNPLYMQKVTDQLKERGTTDTGHIRRVYNFAYSEVMKGNLDSALTNTEAIQVGRYGVQAVMDAGIIRMVSGVGAQGTLNHYVLEEDIHDFLLGYSESDVAQLVNTGTRYMRCQPDPWTTLTDGGYLTARRKAALPLMHLAGIRASERRRLRDEFTAEKMPKVFATANYLQSRAYTMHQPTVEAVARVWHSGGGVLGVPTKTRPTAPEFPFPETWVKEEATEDELETMLLWKRDMVRYYDDLRKWRGRVAEVGGFVRSLNELKPGWPIYFPVYMDTRGRWYYRGTPNLQGSDISKACLHFAHRRVLGEVGLYWLKVHIANSAGYDSERMDKRAAWTDQHWPDFERALDQPEDFPDVWMLDDNPWQLYSACWELREAYRSGDPTKYATGIVVHQDATCSGLQHFSAALRDPVGGEIVNLTNGDGQGPKRDIYRKVGDVARAALAVEVDDPVSARWTAMTGEWDSKRMRKLAKTPVMTYLYGATLLGTAMDVREELTEAERTALVDVAGSAIKGTMVSAKALFSGVETTVPAAAEAMRWLKGVARQMENGERMEWRAPSGFLVQHDYLEYDIKRVDIKSCGQHKIMVREATERTRIRAMQNAIAPNLVHSLDATHLVFTALRMEAAGLDMVAIHDSFGTHPCDVPKLAVAVREAFVELYDGTNVLADFIWQTSASGAVPKQGTLDVRGVLSSEFFFS